MTKLPVVSGRHLVKVLTQIGYELDGQRGSHMFLRHRHPPHRRLTVPDRKEIAKGTLRNILRESGLTVEELVRLL